MKSRLRLLPVAIAACSVSFLSGSNATAQSGAALRVTIEPDFLAGSAVKAGFPLDYTVYVKNDGPDDAFNIALVNHVPFAVSGLVSSCHQTSVSATDWKVTCYIPQLRAGETTLFNLTLPTPLSGHISMTATISSQSLDPSRSQTSATLDLPVTDDSDLDVFFSSQSSLFFRVEPGTHIEYRFGVRNTSLFPAKSFRFSFLIPSGFVLERADFPSLGTCEALRRLVLCSADLIPALSSLSDPAFFVIQVDARATASPRGGYFPLVASVSSQSHEYDPSNNIARSFTQVYRHYGVTNVEDSGAGSLRQAIEDANAECDRDRVPCRIDFDIPAPPPNGGWFTIRPTSPLPPITAGDFSIDGSTQTAKTGDTNPFGPEIEINGDLCSSGSGLEIRSSRESLVAELVVNGFPENGLLIDRVTETAYPSPVVRNNYIGTDATGTRAVPNTLRGIAWKSSGFGVGSIVDNIISGNGRSGIFVESGQGLDIERNRIGTQASADKPLPNGSSGIYFGKSAFCGTVMDNVIAYNAAFGVAVEAGRDVAVQKNSIMGNGLPGIDIGLDGETPGDPFSGDLNIVHRPTIESARYDSVTGLTKIRGKFVNSVLQSEVDLYSSPSPDFQGATWLGQVSNTSEEFVFDYPGNLLGQYVTGTMTLDFFEGFSVEGETLGGCGGGLVHSTSEFSVPVAVAQ